MFQQYCTVFIIGDKYVQIDKIDKQTFINLHTYNYQKERREGREEKQNREKEERDREMEKEGREREQREIRRRQRKINQVDMVQKLLQIRNFQKFNN